MKILKKIADEFETSMVAATFAEAGEFETAREIMREKTVERKRKTAKKTQRMTARSRDRK